MSKKARPIKVNMKFSNIIFLSYIQVSLYEGFVWGRIDIVSKALFI